MAVAKETGTTAGALLPSNTNFDSTQPGICNDGLWGDVPYGCSVDDAGSIWKTYFDESRIVPVDCHTKRAVCTQHEEVGVDVYDISIGTAITIKAVATSVSGQKGFATFHGIVSEADVAPTNIHLSSSTVQENSAADTTIGTLSSVDGNQIDSWTYTIPTQYSTFVKTSGSALLVHSANSFDFETQTSVSIQITTTDSSGLSFTKTFVLTVLDVNEPPYNMTLSTGSVLENTVSGYTIGVFAVADPEGHAITWTLLDNDGSRFALQGAELKVIGDINYEVQTSRSITIRAQDQGSPAQLLDQLFTLNVVDVNEPPSDIVLSNTAIKEQCAEVSCSAESVGVPVG